VMKPLPKIESADVILGMIARATCCSYVGMPLNGAMFLRFIVYVVQQHYLRIEVSNMSDDENERIKSEATVLIAACM